MQGAEEGGSQYKLFITPRYNNEAWSRNSSHTAVAVRFSYHPLHQALGTGIASELDLAYWHARYTAASRFDAGCVTADPASSFHVVPPPEVYFVGLAFRVPSVAELRALPLSPALRRTLADVFDLPVGDAEVAGRPSSGVRVCVRGGELLSRAWVQGELRRRIAKCKGDLARVGFTLFICRNGNGEDTWSSHGMACLQRGRPTQRQ